MKASADEVRGVDKDALKKAEDVLKKKQDKKDKAGPKVVANKYGTREATASQVWCSCFPCFFYSVFCSCSCSCPGVW